MLQSMLCFLRREMIADPARAGLSRVIVMYSRCIVPGLLFAPPVKLNIADLVVKDDDLLCTCRLLEQLLNLRIIHLLYFCAIVKVLYGSFVMKQLKSLAVKRRLISKAGITNQNRVWLSFPGGPWNSRGRVVGVYDRPVGRLGEVV